MKIAVLSGKGGTGKTFVAVNLATVAGDSLYIDCDVEEPNGRLFFQPQAVKSQPVNVGVPVVTPEKCTGCRICVDFCNFNALAWTGGRLRIFPEICHSCGGCMLLCPEQALTEKMKTIGRVESGVSGKVIVLTGILNPGEASGVPIIKELLAMAPTREQVLIDSPPGSACIVMETVAAADYCILVAEPTIFGVHNLDMVWRLVTLMGKTCGVVLNKCLETVNPAEVFCQESGIEIIGRIPFSTELGLLNSNAKIAAAVSQEYKALFEDMLSRVTRGVSR